MILVCADSGLEPDPAKEFRHANRLGTNRNFASLLRTGSVKIVNFNDGFWRFCRFCIAGLGNMAFHFVIAWSAMQFAMLTMASANLVGCIAATILSYLVNSLFVFRVDISARIFARFALVNTVVLAFAYFAGAVADYLNWPVLVAVVMTSAFGVTVGFAAHSLVTFRPRQ